MISTAVKELQSAKKEITTKISSLEKEAKQIDQAIAALSGLSVGGVKTAPAGKRTMSATAKAKLSAFQKARWAKINAGKATATKPAKKKFVMSPAHLKALAKARELRWAKVKTATAPVAKPAKKKTMSAAARAKISAAVKARWAKINAAKKK